MKDFNEQGLFTADQAIAKDIIFFPKGWNKFAPHIGVGALDLLKNVEVNVGRFKQDCEINLEAGGVSIESLQINPEGKLNLELNEN